jgi:nicotinamidase/pyrazinamidase
MTRMMLVDVDTQVDFMAPDGALYVPGAVHLNANLALLVAACRKARVPHLATLDTHTPDDPEFAAFNFPPHCVKGTPGHAKIAATAQVAPLLLTDARAVTPLALKDAELLFPKATFDVFSNAAFRLTVEKLAPALAIVVGVATDYCVKAAVLGLLAMGVSVVLVTDALASVSTETGDAALAEMLAKGARMQTTHEVLALLEREVTHVA